MPVVGRLRVTCLYTSQLQNRHFKCPGRQMLLGLGTRNSIHPMNYANISNQRMHASVKASLKDNARKRNSTVAAVDQKSALVERPRVPDELKNSSRQQADIEDPQLLARVLAESELTSRESVVKIPGEGQPDEACKTAECTHVDRVDSWKGQVVLLAVPFLWAAYGIILKYLFSLPEPPAPSVITFARKFLSVPIFLLLLPLERQLSPPQSEGVSSLLKASDSNESFENRIETLPLTVSSRSSSSSSMSDDVSQPVSVLRRGAELGTWVFLGTGFQAWGLEYTTATRAGFEFQVKNILVPLLSYFLLSEAIGPNVWGATALALFGIFLLKSAGDGSQNDITDDQSEEAMAKDLDLEGGAEGKMEAFGGDLAILTAAFFYAMNTVRVSVHSRAAPSVQLNAVSAATGTALSAGWVIADAVRLFLDGGDPLVLLQGLDNPLVVATITLTGIVGVTASLGQTYGQSMVSPSQAQILYSTMPLYQAALAVLLLGERIGPLGWVGGGAIIAAAAMASMKSVANSKGK